MKTLISKEKELKEFIGLQFEILKNNIRQYINEFFDGLCSVYFKLSTTAVWYNEKNLLDFAREINEKK